MNYAKKVLIPRNTGASHSASLRFVLILVFLASVFWPPVSGLYAQTELGSEDDLTVLGTNGTAGDPDTEIKGFTVFGSTQAGYTGAVIGSGNVVVNGVLSVSSGAYFVGDSTFTNAGKIFINDGSSGQVLRKGAAGSLTWENVSALGDDLGSHVATQNLVLQANQLTGAGALTMSSITASGPLGMWAARLVFDPNIEISSYTSAVYGKGVYLSTFVFTPGLAITQYGELQTTGAGRGSVAGAARGPGAVDLQVNRGLATQVASGGYAVIGGGQQNTAAGLYAVVTGGSQNTAGNQYSTVGGGVGNNASGDRAVVPGGDTNLAGGLGSFAAGSYARAGAAGAFTWADSQGVAIDNAVVDRTVFKNRGGFLVTGSTNPALSGAANRGVLLTGDGLVGISTGTPYAALDVVSTGTAAGQMAQVWRDSGGTIVSSVSATGVLMAAKFIGNGSGLTGIPGDNLGNHTATQNLDLSGRELVGVSTLTVSSITTAGAGVIFSTNAYFTNGSVGIGTTNPAKRLEVAGNTPSIRLNDTGGANLYWDFIGGAAAAGDLAVANSGGTRFYLNSAGNIGIGTTGPGAKLQLAAVDDSVAPVLSFRQGNAPAYGYDWDHDTLVNGDLSLMRVENSVRSQVLTIQRNSGNIGIGTTSPGAKLDFAAVTGEKIRLYGDGNAAYSIGVEANELRFAGGIGANDFIAFRTQGYTGTERVRLTGTGNVGIGTTGPEAKLHVSGGDVNAASFKVEGSSYVILNAGNVGIGTTGPSAKLDVAGSLRSTGWSSPATGTGVEIGYVSGTGRILAYNRDTNAYSSAELGTPGQLFLKSDGNVGIGTTAPGSRFEVVGGSSTFKGSDSNSAIAGFTDAGGNYRVVISTPGNVGIGTTDLGSNKLSVAGNISLQGGSFMLTGASASPRPMFGSDATAHGQTIVRSIDSDAGDGIQFQNYAGSALAEILNSGNVGIGTTAPGYKLEVNGSFNATSVYSNGALLSPGTGSNWTVSGPNIYRSAGNVGIGTASPGQALHINSDNVQLFLASDNDPWAAGLFIRKTPAATPVSGYNGPDYAQIINTENGPMVFGTNNTEWIRLLANGNVGIGTTSPVSKLDIRGTIYALGNLAGYNPIDAENTNVGGYGPYFAGGGGDPAKYMLAVADYTGSQKFKIDGLGNVGIGTASPAVKLHVETGAAGSPSAIFRQTHAGDSPGIQIYQRYGGAGDDLNYGIQLISGGVAKFWVRGDGTTYNQGNVGIGTTAPTHNLHVAGNAIVGSSLSVSGSGLSGTAAIFRVAGDSMTVLANGNIGIGTADPGNSKLRVKAGSVSNSLYNRSLSVEGDNNTFISMGIDNSLGANGRAWITAARQGVAMLDILLAPEGGNVGIGTTAPGYKLDVNGDMNLAAGGVYRIGGVAQSGSSKWTQGTGDNIYRTLGNVGIGTGDPSLGVPLEVAKTAGIYGPVIGLSGPAGAGGKTFYMLSSASGNSAGAGKFVLYESGHTGDLVIDNYNVGIGTTSPESRLHIRPGTDQNIKFSPFVNGGNGTALTASNDIAANKNNFEIIASNILLTPTNNVGIGTTAPAARLDINSGGTTKMLLGVNTSNGNYNAISLNGNNADNSRIGLTGGGSGDGQLYIDAVTNIAFRPNSAAVQTVTMLGNGNVGIGLTNPGGRLHITAGADTYSLRTSGGSLETYLTQGSGMGIWYTNSVSGFNINNQSAFLSFSASNAEVMRLTGGNVGIGTTAPVNKLHVYGAGASASTSVNNGIATIGATSGVQLSMGTEPATPYGFYLQTKDANNAGPYGYPILLNPINGNVGIGIVNPLYKLDVVGTLRINNTHYSHMLSVTTPQTHIEFANANGAVGSITTSGSATAYNTSSDRRLKEHISTTTTGLAALARIPVVDFNFISDPDRRVQGFVAQDLYKYYPEAVNVGGADPKKTPWSVDYGRLTPLLVKSVQELDQRTKELKTAAQLNDVVLKATDGGACYRLTVNSTGVLNTVPAPCP